MHIGVLYIVREVINMYEQADCKFFAHLYPHLCMIRALSSRGGCISSLLESEAGVGRVIGFGQCHINRGDANGGTDGA